ncbi:MAG TPA: NAD(P)-binding protein [Thermoanaerobaculia bacterium]|nr:NAD(P)-binding protein [Thermoanaerobaculia bacterium]
MRRFDLAVVGSGFGGALLALAARRLGRSVVVLEKGAHPRFAIGESTSPLANLLLERLALRYDLPQVLPLAKWGTWQARLPHLRGGVKRGFTFFHHRRGREPLDEGELRNPLLVAASPNAAVADTHWYRADVDLHLLEQARAAGAEYVDRIALDRFEADGKAVRLSGRRGGERVDVEARWVADASGPRGFLHGVLGLGESEFPGLPRTAALYAHFRGVAPMTEIAPLSSPPPYPVDDAALHHVFEGGWIWVLRFADGTVSAGAMLSPELALEVRAEEGEAAWRRLLKTFPAIDRQFRRAESLFPLRYSEKVAFRTTAASGPGWWMLPSAAAFVDPLLSTGIPLTLLGVARAAAALEESNGDAGFERSLAELSARTLDEADSAASLVAALWRSFDDFPTFCAATMLYFAAASFGEASCRLGRDGLPGFLGSDRPPLRHAISEALRSVDGDSSSAVGVIRRAIEPWNVAGLLDPARRNWYPVCASDLREGASKLGASSIEVERLLERSGFGNG